MRQSGKLPRVPWISSDGSLDFSKIPLDAVARQAFSGSDSEARGACSVLGQVAAAGRPDATTFLLGLLRWYRGDLSRLNCVVDALGFIPTSEAADALADELRRVESSNSTRSYLNNVLKALSKLPQDLAQPRLEALASEPGFSAKLKVKFRRAAEELKWRGI